MNNEADLAEVLRKVMEYRLADVRVAIPGRVQTYDLATQTADIQPLISEAVETEDGDDIENLPLIPSVPIANARGGGFFVSFPLVPGDTGLLVICDRNIDQWMATGLIKDPLDRRKHGLSGAVFYPGLSDSAHPLVDAHATDLVIGEDGGSSIHLKPGGEIQIGSAPTEYVALANLVATELAAIKTWADTHTHTGVTVGAGVTGIGTALGAAGSVAAGNVKAD